MTPGYRYVHVLEGEEDDVKYFFVENLGASDIYRTQLVLQQRDDGLFRPLVRKIYQRRTLRSQGKTETDKLHEHDIKTTTSLRRAILKTNVEPRIAAYQSQVSFAVLNRDKYFRVSYWTFQNGGTLHSFLKKFRKQKVTVPSHFVAHVLHQLLQTLDQMYKLPEPVFHGAITVNNLHLHFDPSASSSRPPNLILTNFSQASTAPFPKRGAEWDIPAVVDLIRTHFPGFWAVSSTLDSLHTVFLSNRTAARHSRSDTNLIKFAIPCLKQPITMLQGELSSTKEEWKNAVAFRKSISHGRATPMQPKTYESIDEILDATGVLGPWKVGKMDMNTGKVKVLREEASFHRPNTGNDGSDTEDSDDDVEEGGFVVLDEHDCDEDEGWVVSNRNAGTRQQSARMGLESLGQLGQFAQLGQKLLDKVFPRL
ncbi:hypothetical protein B0T16DRAFT_463309 [Cercophora newfieldiana]|uniref:Protein kinase domain-containing protein n=1 Tax=Cercophora newfieldiana TaxID=92897 RepID=A0AA39XSY1_9PEZI|nr:hypothetical protein B0T16DRAFT_463309 [Cercophora newfieldiana]